MSRISLSLRTSRCEVSAQDAGNRVATIQHFQVDLGKSLQRVPSATERRRILPTSPDCLPCIIVPERSSEDDRLAAAARL
eukprot:6210162-Pleurochrysis_carterae.AAC.1